MKNVGVFFALLLIAFFGIWAFKANHPVDRPENAETKAEKPWYLSSYTTPTVEETWKIDKSIPQEYIPVPGETGLYMVLDTDGKVKMYLKRTKDEEGKEKWEEVNPDVPQNYELIAGTTNRYKMTDEQGNTTYYLYVRNEDDDSFAFVACDEFGTPYYDGTKADVITSQYQNYDGNIYTVYNPEGVKEGYAERKKEEDGSYVWKYVDEPSVRQYALDKQTTEAAPVQPAIPETKKTEFADDGLYEEKETVRRSEIKNGFRIVYEKVVVNTYNKKGELVFSDEGKEQEIEKTPIGIAAEAPDSSLVKDTLDEEYQRVSEKVNYKTGLAEDMLELLNKDRIAAGLVPLVMDKNSEAYKLAVIRAGDLATYKPKDKSESPMYGTLLNMVKKWNCTSTYPCENVLEFGNSQAQKIHEYMMSQSEGVKELRLSQYYTGVGIAVAESNGILYIAEIYLQ